MSFWPALESTLECRKFSMITVGLHAPVHSHTDKMEVGEKVGVLFCAWVNKAGL